MGNERGRVRPEPRSGESEAPVCGFCIIVQHQQRAATNVDREVFLALMYHVGKRMGVSGNRDSDGRLTFENEFCVKHRDMTIATATLLDELLPHSPSLAVGGES